MRQLFPVAADDVALADAYGHDRRPHGGRPWVLVNMISSTDGAVTVDGRSGGLGGPADRAVFRHLRSLPDVIMVGAGTVRAERYGPPRPPSRARIAVVTRRVELDWTAPLFTEHRAYVVTTAGADVAGDAPVDVIRAGTSTVDLADGLARLAERGTQVVLCEGGPSLNGELFAADLVDELCLTLAPLVAGGAGPRIVSAPAIAPPATLELAGVLEEDGALLLRYLRRRTPAAA